MTLTADRGSTSPGPFDERRGTSREPRRSWASEQPFVRRSTVENGPAGRAGISWSRASLEYVQLAGVLDAMVAFGVACVTSAVILGFDFVSLGLASATTVGFVALLAGVHGYDRSHVGDGPDEFRAVLRAGVGLALAFMVLSFVFGVTVPPAAVLVGVPVLVVLVGVERHVLRRRLHRARSAGLALIPTLVVGDSVSAAQVIDELAGAVHHGYWPVGACLVESGDSHIEQVPVLGGLADIVQVAADRAIEVVLVTGSALTGDALRRLSWALGRVGGAHLVVVPSLVEVAGPRLRVRPTAGLSLLEVEVGAPRRRLWAKAVLDRVVGLVALAASALVVVPAAVAVALTSPGGAFFRQTRVGVDGRPFTMWKLRTMSTDAGDRRAGLLASSDAAGPLFKMRHDPRVTPVGRILRRYSIDELPQLWNVVRGDMSLVGPRPPLLEEVDEYLDPVRRRLHVRPGLTGLWQVSGRSDLTWEESVKLDLRYVDNWSLTMDLLILWKTGRAVLHGAGAY